jgi:Ca2+-binding RTX toxin-like protein
LDLILYEGGQHAHHAEGGATNDAAYNQFMIHFVRSPEMAVLYQVLWAEWGRIGQGPFMQYVESGEPSKFGSWGLQVTNLDTPPRAGVVTNLNATSQVRWENRGGSHFQQGAIVHRSGDGAVLVGTDAEDYLIGGEGNDVIYPGTGNDGVNGGSGVDVALLKGARSAYAIRDCGRGYCVSGPDGTDYFFAVEVLSFESEGRITLGAAEPEAVVAQ